MKISTRDVPRTAGHRAAAPPREVYRYDPDGGGPVCDVAPPVIGATV